MENKHKQIVTTLPTLLKSKFALPPLDLAQIDPSHSHKQHVNPKLAGQCLPFSLLTAAEPHRIFEFGLYLRLSPAFRLFPLQPERTPFCPNYDTLLLMLR